MTPRSRKRHRIGVIAYTPRKYTVLTHQRA